ncbi:MAG: hypothetical protein WBL61_16255 [Bryobacteraceae bacterium]
MEMHVPLNQQLGNLIDYVVIRHPARRPCNAFPFQQSSHGKHFWNVRSELLEPLPNEKKILRIEGRLSIAAFELQTELPVAAREHLYLYRLPGHFTSNQSSQTGKVV